MSGSEWLVVLGAAAGVAWVNWYFFLARRGAKPRGRIGADDKE